ncbi:triosephosphate isomerase [Philodulcilactobacillus myokoensis]|uniref:Triosephosphate isomerase n=1 Tax=Philodulcilactobacillus myokoensis TaxID=2929573 RepID=A0A9W6AZT0_9LACO|nr:triose-phosphate isomerase [Philodulcilactobacillus myokoensis]GLB46414.1 triosephosphate isomerase [Philodulcilactobacillus myokoensis]
MLCVMNFKTKMPIKSQLKMMKEIEQNQFQPRLLVAPSILEPNHYSNFEIVSQDLTTKARTVGEIPDNALKYYGIKYAFIGHIERRTMLKEDYDVINNKLQNAIRNGITPIITVGLSGDQPSKIINEFNQIVQKVDLNHHKIIVAWESMASDKAGKQMYTNPEAKNIFSTIRKRLDQYNGIQYQLLLGGHVEADEAKLSKEIGIDGVLIGDRFRTFASLKPILDGLSD